MGDSGRECFTVSQMQVPVIGLGKSESFGAHCSASIDSEVWWLRYCNGIRLPAELPICIDSARSATKNSIATMGSYQKRRLVLEYASFFVPRLINSAFGTFTLFDFLSGFSMLYQLSDSS